MAVSESADGVDTTNSSDQASLRGIPRGVWILIGTLFTNRIASSAQVVALGLLVYNISGRELDLGLLGLAEFAPLFLLSPLSGTFADRYDRRIVFACGLIVELLATVGFLLFARSDVTSIAPILGLVLIFGSARAFIAPASRALPIDLAPKDKVERIVALRSVAFQSANILGPIIAGLLFVIGRWLPFLIVMIGFSLTLLALAFVPATGVRQLQSQAGPAQVLRDAVDGLRFMRRSPVVFGAITLDLFAVLFGGAVALLPAIGEKRLGVDEDAVGFLYSAIGIGALITASILAVKPIRRHVGAILFLVIGIFGAATIVLGLTRSYVVAFCAILVLSAADAISVFIRATIVPLATPEAMRGRILAVENIFIGGSNELGALESGMAAATFGIFWAVVGGGVGTLAVVGIGMLAFPTLRKVDRFEDIRAAEEQFP